MQIGSHSFTFDNVYGSTGLPSSAIYDDCVAPRGDAPVFFCSLSLSQVLLISVSL